MVVVRRLILICVICVSLRQTTLNQKPIASRKTYSKCEKLTALGSEYIVAALNSSKGFRNNLIPSLLK